MYSQRDEERVILEVFDGRQGALMDLGAFDGRTFSNTLALIERGWTGVLVEASPYAFIKLMAEHKDRPHLNLVNTLVHALGGEPLVPFHVTEDALSSTEPAHVKKWESQASFQKIYMRATSLRELM